MAISNHQCSLTAVVAGFKEHSTGNTSVRFQTAVKTMVNRSRKRKQTQMVETDQMIPMEGCHEEQVSEQLQVDGPRIICKSLVATFLLDETLVMLDDGAKLTPTQFELRAGSGASKKWRQSVRVLETDQPIGAFLSECHAAAPVVPATCVPPNPAASEAAGVATRAAQQPHGADRHLKEGLQKLGKLALHEYDLAIRDQPLSAEVQAAWAAWVGKCDGIESPTDWLVRYVQAADV